MKKRLSIWAGSLVLMCSLPVWAADANTTLLVDKVNEKLTCQGKMLNPINDICWSCMFPIRIGGKVVMNQDNQEDNHSSKDSRPLCTCSNPSRTGISTAFWEPTHLVEVVRTPFCMVSLGGISLKGKTQNNAAATTQAASGNSNWLQKLFGGSHSRGGSKEDEHKNAFWQVHWYKNPVVFWIEAMLDNECVEAGTMDIGWLTELDPTWKNPSLAILQAPDSALFANVVAQAACAADCIKANLGFPSDTLYWCAGCHGTVYPLSGWMGGQMSEVQAARLMVARMQTKMHRDLVAWRAAGKDAMCGYKLNPVMDKSNYKMAMTYPVPARKFNGKCCEPIGRSTLVRDSGKAFPYKGSQFAFQLFRKRDCCAQYGTSFTK